MSRSAILMDFDDTLVETTVYFNQAKSRFARLMKGLGFPVDEVLDTLNRFDIKNVQLYGGFMKECFPLALGQTYEYYCRNFDYDYSHSLRKDIEGLGWWVFEQPARPIDGAEDVLSQLHKNTPLFLATKGDPTVQLARVQESGLSRWFQRVYVLADKCSAAYRTIAMEQRISPEASWMVGNSMKSDINPAIRAGFRCIYIHHPHTWDYEDEKPLGGHISVNGITGVVEVIFRRSGND